VKVEQAHWYSRTPEQPPIVLEGRIEGANSGNLVDDPGVNLCGWDGERIDYDAPVDALCAA
jgi:hypothetical protein